MKHVPSIIAALFAVALMLSGNSPTKLDGSPNSPEALAKIAAAHPDWDLADIAKRSPACDCEGKCKCEAPCLCNVVDEEAPPDIAPATPHISAVSAVQPAVSGVRRAIHVPTEIKAPPVFTQPKPAILPMKPVKPAPKQVSQSPVQYGSCGPGGCGPGGCGTRRGIFGRRR